jgi:hypothetical protein
LPPDAAGTSCCDDKRSPVATFSESSSLKMSNCSTLAFSFSFPKVPIFSRAVTSVSFSAMRLMRLARLLFCLTVSSTSSLSTLSAFPVKTSATFDKPVNLIRLASRRFSSFPFLTISSAKPVLNGSSS